MWKYIVGSFLILVAWLLWWLLDLSLWIPITSTVVIVLGVVGLIVFGILRARRAAKELEKALVAQGAQQAKGMRPDLQAEMEEMSKEFDKAVSALKTSKLGEGRAALYALPWQIIIGPPGAGKSTALRNSGLNFPYLSASGGGVKGIGGTRNCDWWMTNEGVILDTAGRWTTHEEDRDEWLGFLDLVKRYRKKKPLNGIIVAISVTDLMTANEQDVSVLAGRIRERLDEVMERLQMSMPVYILFTKCDLLPGFVETFGNLARNERSAIWGFTAPLAKPIDDIADYFLKRFDELTDALERRCIYRMSEERRLTSRERIFSFPHQFDALKKNQSDLVRQIFQTNVFKETPVLRGAYFTSGTQEGRPIDMVMHRLARSFGIESVVTLADPVVEQKSYFLGDLFSNVIFKDADIAVRSPVEQKRQRRQRFILAAAILVTALFISVVPTLAYVESNTLLNKVEAAVDQTEPQLEAEGVLTVDGIARIRAVTDTLENGAPFFERLGMYRGDTIEDPVDRLYADTLRKRVIEHLVAEDVTEMLNFGRTFEGMGPTAKPSPNQYHEMYERLRVHLLLTAPRGEHEPEYEDSLRVWLSEKIAKWWGGKVDVPRGHAKYRAIQDAARFFVDAIADEPTLAFERNEEAVRYVRETLGRLPMQEVVLGSIIRELEGDGYDISLVRLTTQEIAGVAATERVRGAFTRRAWEEQVGQMLDDPSSRFVYDSWVLGRTAPSQERDDTLQLRSHYFRTYIQEWERFLRSIHVTAPTNDDERRALLSELTRGSPTAYERLWFQVNYNMRLEPQNQDSMAAGVQRGTKSLLRRGTQQLQRQGIVGRVVTSALDAQVEQSLRSRPRAERLQDPSAYVMDFDIPEHFVGFLGYGVHLDNQANSPTGLRFYLESLEWVLQTMQTSGDVAARLTEKRADTLARIDGHGRQQEFVDSDWSDLLRSLTMPALADYPPPEPPPEPAARAPTQRQRRPFRRW